MQAWFSLETVSCITRALNLLNSSWGNGLVLYHCSHPFLPFQLHFPCCKYCLGPGLGKCVKLDSHIQISHYVGRVKVWLTTLTRIIIRITYCQNQLLMRKYCESYTEVQWNRNPGNPYVLVSSRTELIFFIGYMLCFGLRRKMMHQRFCCCRAVLTQSHILSRFSCCPASEQAGCVQGAGRGQSQDSWPWLSKGMSHIIWCHAEQ